jgi:MFS family permease
LVGPRLTLCILVILSALSQVDRGIIGLLVQPMKHDLRIDDFQISLLQGAAFGIFYAIFGLPCGAIADRWSRRWLIFIGVMLWSLAAMACGVAASYDQLLLARFFVGVGEAALVPAALSLIADIFPRNRLAGAVAVFSIGTSVGAGVSLAIGGFLLEILEAAPLSLPVVGELQAWQGVFLATGAPGVLAAFLILLVPDPRQGGPRPASASWGDLFGFLSRRRGFFGRHFSGFALLGMLATGTGSWIPVLLMRRYDFSPGAAGVAYGTLGPLVNIVGMLCAGVLLDRLIRRGVTDAPMRIFTWTTPVTLVFTAIGCFSPSPALCLVCLGIAQFGYSLSGPAATAIQFVTPAEMRGRMTALYGLIFNLAGYAFGPSLVAMLTTFVFRDDQAIHLSVVTAVAVVTPIAWLMMLTGLKPMREAMALAEADLPGAARPAA